MTERFTDEEIAKLRRIMAGFSHPDDPVSAGPGHGGDVVLTPGDPSGDEGTVHGRIVLENPGGTTRPMLTIRDGERELDVFFGMNAPGPEVEARKGSLFFQVSESGVPRLHIRRPGRWLLWSEKMLRSLSPEWFADDPEAP